MSISKQIWMSTACAAVMAGGLQAQGVSGVTGGVEKGAAFQYFFTGEPGMTPVRVDAIGAKAVTGKPLSAVEVRRTRQTLGDGTHIDKVEKSKYFRDFEGRTRIERDGGDVLVSDTGNGMTREIANGRGRMMVRSGNFSTAALPAIAPLPEKTIADQPPSEVRAKAMLDKAKAELAFSEDIRGTVDIRGPVGNAVFARGVAAPSPDKGVTEDLGYQVINGVSAHGSRTTITIPVGQIGNDREIKVVSERWFSDDLGLLIKSTNNDPRFGETTFELTEILQGAQDPTLFEMPNSPNFRHN